MLHELVTAAVNIYSPPTHGNQAEGTGISAAIGIGFVLIVAAAASINRPGRREQ